MTFQRYAACLVMLLVISAGCGKAKPPQGEVHGIVTLDGKALSAGQVEFFSSDLGIGALADIGSDGNYVVKDALQVGEYAVTVRDPVPEPGQPAPKSQHIPARYSNAGTSGLKHNVTAGQNQFDIPLAAK